MERINVQQLALQCYVSRGNKLHLLGFFSAKLKRNQSIWIPYKIEALCFAAFLKHFRPYIVPSKFRSTILSNSKL